MKKMRTMSLEEVKTELREGRGGRLVNQSGYGVYQDQQGKRFYIFDHDKPMAYNQISVMKAMPSLMGPLAKMLSQL